MFVTQTSILPGYRTDHSMITIAFTLNTNPRGPGYWKLNTSFLSEIEYINQIPVIINTVAKEYKNDSTVNDSLLWEMIKMKIREYSLKYAKQKKQRMKSKEADLEASIFWLEKSIEQNELSNDEKDKLTDELNTKKKELEQFVQYKTKGSIIRSKARWYN